MTAHTSICIRELPGCENVEYVQITTPTFIDKTTQARAVRSMIFPTIEELADYIKEHSGRIYIYYCEHMQEDDKSQYLLRAVVVDTMISNVADVIDVYPVTVDSNFIPYIGAKIKINLEVLTELTDFWGHDEVARQIGHIIISRYKNYIENKQQPQEAQ